MDTAFDKGMMPIAKTGISDALVDRILGFITAGKLRPGNRLPSEREMADRFGVSRPTVREAMRALSVLGVVEIRHGGGAFVTALNPVDLLGPLNFILLLSDVSVDQLYDARCLIEGEICALAAKHATEQDCAILDDLIAAQKRAKSYADEYLKLDTQFHEHLGALSHNPFLARASQSLNMLGIEFRTRAATTEEPPQRSISDHKLIVAALRAQDSEGARQAMVAHMEQVRASTDEADSTKDAP